PTPSPKNPIQPTPESPGNPRIPLVPDWPGGPRLPALPESPSTPESKPPAAPANPMLSAVEELEKQHGEIIKSFQNEANHQGVFGSLVDGAKNHIGSTAENRSWYNPAALWSNVFDYNAGSKHTGEQLDAQGERLKELRQAAQNADAAAFKAKY